jgi:Zn-dependent membrane protease YugP
MPISDLLEEPRLLESAGVTGADAASAVMRAGGVQGVAIEPVAGELSDHYDSSV